MARKLFIGQNEAVTKWKESDSVTPLIASLRVQYTYQSTHFATLKAAFSTPATIHPADPLH